MSVGPAAMATTGTKSAPAASAWVLWWSAQNPKRWWKTSSTAPSTPHDPAGGTSPPTTVPGMKARATGATPLSTACACWPVSSGCLAVTSASATRSTSPRPAMVQSTRSAPPTSSSTMRMQARAEALAGLSFNGWHGVTASRPMMAGKTQAAAALSARCGGMITQASPSPTMAQPRT